MHDWSGAGTKPLGYQPLTHRCGPPFQHRVTQCPRLCVALSGGKWVTIQPVKQRVKSTPPKLYGLRVWEGWFPKGKLKCFLPEERRDRCWTGKKKKTTTVCFKQAASYYACHKQGKSHLLAFQTISPLCCPSPPFPHQIFIDRALVQP